jgi:hypothetical protein
LFAQRRRFKICRTGPRPRGRYVFSGTPFSPLPAEGEGAGVRGSCRPGAPLTRPSATLSPKGRGNNAKHVQGERVNGLSR